MRFQHIIVGVLATMAFVLVIGCDQNPFTKIQEIEKTVDAQNARMDELEKKIESTRVEELEKRIVKLESKIFFELTKNQYESATFDPAADDGFQRIDTSIGPLVVYVQDVKPHADGVKVRLKVGNLTIASFKGGNFKVKWGPRFSKSEGSSWYSAYGEWTKKLQEKEGKFTEILKPGVWNNISLTLPGIPSDQLGHLELSFDTNEILLLTK